MTRRRVLFYVQHLLGIGHLRRAVALARACAARDLEVTVASGGAPVAGLDTAGAALVQLPPLRSRDESFSALVCADGQAPDAAWLDRRRTMLLDLFARVKPHVLVVEMFPFGRRQLRFELLPLLTAARAAAPRPWVVSSVRDVLTARAPKRTAEAAAWARRYFDAVLVHGDPEVIRFEESFPAAAEIADMLSYTGYVAEPAGGRGGPGAPGAPGWNEVVASAGGGAVGEIVLRTALEARPLSRSGCNLDWRLLAGENLSAEAFAALTAEAPKGVIVERSRPDFADLLANCAVSISQGGYNTVVNILQARAQAVIVPFSRGGQTEQSLRAARLEALGLVRCLDERGLTPARLATTVDAALAAPQPPHCAVAIDGAVRSAAMITTWAKREHE